MLRGSQPEREGTPVRYTVHSSHTLVIYRVAIRKEPCASLEVCPC